MKIILYSLCGLAMLFPSSPAGKEELIYPDAVEKCLDDPAVKELEVLATRNPVYLRGDFDGDGKPDYALIVRKPKTTRNGILVCSGNGKAILLGAAVTGKVFSNMPADRFVAPYWQVYSRPEIAELTRSVSNVPKPIPDAKGEAIGMMWEDGIALIYWDGSRYRWAGVRQ
jgi:hypothetical protein